MKRLLLGFIMFLPILVSQAKDVRSIDDLAVGDIFNLTVTMPLNETELKSVWTFEDVQKINIGFEVLSVDNDSLRLAVKPKNRFICLRAHEFQDLFEREGVVVNNYYDSDYFAYFDNKPVFFLFADNAVVASVNRKDGATNIRFDKKSEDLSTGRSAKDWYTQLFQLPKGLGMVQFGGTVGELRLDFERLLKTTLSNFFTEWSKTEKTTHDIPYLIELKSSTEKEEISYIELSSASFDLRPNTRVQISMPKDFPEYNVFMMLGDERIDPVSRNENTYLFRFFMPKPQRGYVKDLILDLSPNDSLIVVADKMNSTYKFQGKGAANSAYTNEIVKLYDGAANIGFDKKSEQDVFLSKGEQFYEAVLLRHAKNMNDYWLRSARLSFDYWRASEMLNAYNEKVKSNWGNSTHDESAVLWSDKHIVNLFPFADYLYQPYTYGKLLELFFSFKARQANNSILTGVKYLEGDIPKYYFTDAVFWGYPRFYLTSQTLKDKMIHFHLVESNREYEDFMTKCGVPELRNQIQNLHEQLEKVEPGANIKGLKLDIEKHIPMSNQSGEYVVLFVAQKSDNLDENFLYLEDQRRGFEHEIANGNMKGKVKVCFIMGESERAKYASDPSLSKQIVFVENALIQDYADKVVSHKEDFIVMRADGTIIDRWQNSKYSSTPYFILKEIKEDVKQQQEQDSALGGVLFVILIVLVSVVITFFVVRYFIVRREKQKRQIQELELKAIRAQMNPHFTFNALGSIQNLISSKKEDEANEYLVNFSKLLRMVLMSSEKKLISLSDEIEMLNLYLRLEQLRVPFEYNILLGEGIDAETEEIPGMLIQPIVENAVKHAIVPDGGGQINIEFNQHSNIMYVVVSDSGKGFDEKKSKGTTSFGLKSVRERLGLINKELHLDISLKIENIREGNTVKGCRVALSIPV